MELNSLQSQQLILQNQLQQQSEAFDFALEQKEDYEAAKLIYREIKELRSRIREMNA